MKSILSVGMDVHKNSFSLCAYDGYTGKIVSESTFASDVKLVIKFIETLKSRYENEYKSNVVMKQVVLDILFISC